MELVTGAREDKRKAVGRRTKPARALERYVRDSQVLRRPAGLVWIAVEQCGGSRGNDCRLVHAVAKEHQSLIWQRKDPTCQIPIWPLGRTRLVTQICAGWPIDTRVIRSCVDCSLNCERIIMNPIAVG